MRTCQFNFNNEADVFTVHLEEDGTVTIPGNDGEVIAEYDSMQQLAEIYAQSRDVRPDNLKNWILLENGDTFSFVLRAGTAGINVCEVEEQLEEVFESLTGRFHPLNIARAKEQIMGDGTADLTAVLIHCTETDIAREVYDDMADQIAGNGEAAPAETVAEEDIRTPIQAYLDQIAEQPGRLALCAVLAGLPADSERAAVEEALEASYALSNVETLALTCRNVIADAMERGINVCNERDAIMVITQAPVDAADEAMKTRLIETATLARRNAVNIVEDVVGTHHIRHAARLVSLAELATLNLYARGNTPVIVIFSDTVDEELEAEQEAAQAALAADAADDYDDVDEEDDFEDEEDDFEDDFED